MIRRAEERDASDIARIYNQSITPGAYSAGQTVQVSVDERIEWLKNHQDPYPVWVYESEEHRVVAWCCLSRFPVRDYPAVAEVSRYVDRTYHARGIGSKLSEHLIVEGRRLGFRSLVSISYEKNLAMAVPNLRYGFRPNVVLIDQAYSNGSLANVIWFQKELSESD